MPRATYGSSTRSNVHFHAAVERDGHDAATFSQRRRAAPAQRSPNCNPENVTRCHLLHHRTGVPVRIRSRIAVPCEWCALGNRGDGNPSLAVACRSPSPPLVAGACHALVRGEVLAHVRLATCHTGGTCKQRCAVLAISGEGTCALATLIATVAHVVSQTNVRRACLWVLCRYLQLVVGCFLPAWFWRSDCKHDGNHAWNR